MKKNVFLKIERSPIVHAIHERPCVSEIRRIHTAQMAQCVHCALLVFYTAAAVHFAAGCVYFTV